MKKQGFTLAEVLITLTIIGVVAVLTLPALMTNTNEQQARTALAKMANTFTNAAHMAQTNLGFDFSDIDSADQNTSGTAFNINETTQSLYNILGNTASINLEVNQNVQKQNTTPGTPNSEIIFKDGTSLLYTAANTLNDFEGVDRQQTDGGPFGIQVIFDTNGTKGPNVVSNCVGTVTGIREWGGDDAGNCTNKNQRVIKDRFMMRLSGANVVPQGAASLWALTGAVGAVPAINTSTGDDRPAAASATP